MSGPLQDLTRRTLAEVACEYLAPGVRQPYGTLARLAAAHAMNLDDLVDAVSREQDRRRMEALRRRLARRGRQFRRVIVSPA